MRHKVTTDAIFAHLQRLQQIADANGGNRAVATPGYDASVEYIAKTLRDKGFDVQTAGFDFRQFQSGEVSLTVNGETVPTHVLQYSAGTGPDAVSGPLVAAPAEDTPGCSASDYDRLPVSGAVVLVDRGSCEFSVKEKVAVQRGAVGLVIADNIAEERMSGTLGAQTDVKIPVVCVSKDDGVRLRAASGPATIKLAATTTTITARNVIAQTSTSSCQDVVTVGAHLDSVPAGPGIDDNGSGVAAVLETALQMGSSPPIRNAVRFGFWGAEEIGLVGLDKYIETLNLDALKDIALYLNFDMIASPNPGYFAYSSGQSDPQNPNPPTARPPDGSAAAEHTLVTYLASAGKTEKDTSLGGRSDYQSFMRAGIPAAGLFSGAEEKKTAAQARQWGGQADQPFDPNYHKPSDTLQNIDRTALAINGGGVAYTVSLYAQDTFGADAIPLRQNRNRQLITNP